MAGKHSYFAYGSNLCVRQMAQRCPDASDPRRATLSDHDWLINERGVATVERFAGAEVHGVIWQLSDHDLATLDSAEGVPVRYRRDELTVHTDTGDRKREWELVACAVPRHVLRHVLRVVRCPRNHARRRVQHKTRR